MNLELIRLYFSATKSLSFVAGGVTGVFQVVALIIWGMTLLLLRVCRHGTPSSCGLVDEQSK